MVVRFAPSLGLALLLAAGCYAGRADHDHGVDTDAPAPDDPPPSSEDGDADDPLAGFDPDPSQIRLLSAHEYRNTVRDLLGVEASPELAYGDVSSGFDNGAGGLLDEALFDVLYVEAQRVAEAYAAGPGRSRFECVSPVAPLSGACRDELVDTLGPRALRRPLDAPTRQALIDFVDTIATDADGGTEALQVLVTRLLMSPQFLYRSEVGLPDPNVPGRRVLDPFERASLLSYALTGSLPDDALWADAAADRLDEDAVRAHVARLLDTPAGRAQLVRLFAQWLRVTELARLADNAQDYPKLASAAQGRALAAEFAAFVEHVVIDDHGTFDDVLSRAVTYVDRHTAPLYGAASTSEILEPLPLDARRGGILTLASVMAVHSSSADPTRDKPIRRGLLVLNQLLCQEVGLPAGIDVQSAAAAVQQDVDDFDALTTREQLELIMNQDPLCETCHATFMPFGFLWGNFDALGQYQTHFGPRPIDTAVADLAVDGEPRSYADVMALAGDLAASEQVTRCFAGQVVRHASGRREDHAVAALADALAPAVASGDLSIRELLVEVLSRPELYVREGGP